MHPKGWNNETWNEYSSYLQNLTSEELKTELELLQLLGEAKKEGKNIIPNETFYIM